MPTRFLARGLAAVLLALTLPAAAQSLTDHWYSPGEPGWGLSIQHQRNTLFVVLFVYSPTGADASGRSAAQWYVAPDVRLEIIEQFSHYKGKLYAVRGSPHAAAFDPALTQATEVGEISITRDSFEFDGQVVYNIGAVQRTKAIRRMSFAAPDLSGTYLVTMSGFVGRSTQDSQCTSLQPGHYVRRETWVVAPDGAEGWRVTRQADDINTTTQAIEVIQLGSRLQLRLRIGGRPMEGNGYADLDAHGFHGWLGSFRTFSDATTVVTVPGHPPMTVPQCRYDASLSATRFNGQN